MVPGRRVVMAGMGFIGSEVAASLRQRGLEVHVVAGGKAPLDRVLGEEVGRVLEGIHRDHGVEMTFDDQVTGFEGNGRVRAVTTANGLRLDCDFVVLGLGVEPVTDFLDGIGDRRGRRGARRRALPVERGRRVRRRRRRPALSIPSSGSGSARSTGTTRAGRAGPPP